MHLYSFPLRCPLHWLLSPSKYERRSIVIEYWILFCCPVATESMYFVLPWNLCWYKEHVCENIWSIAWFLSFHGFLTIYTKAWFGFSLSKLPKHLTLFGSFMCTKQFKLKGNQPKIVQSLLELLQNFCRTFAMFAELLQLLEVCRTFAELF